MFKIIKIDFYDDFACLMSKCPDNCCDEDWDIYIDDAAIEKYRQMGISDLSEKITETIPHKLIKKDGKCPFITPEGLCTFHRDYGEEYLSNTCRSYPRFVSTYGDVYLETLGMSCPATVRNVLELKKPVEFPEQMYYEDTSEVGKILEQTETEKLARKVIGQFASGNKGISAFMGILEETSSAPYNIPCINELIDKLRNVTKGTPSESYVSSLYGDGTEYAWTGSTPAVSDPEILHTEDILYRQKGYFSCNVIRIWLLLLACLRGYVDEMFSIEDGLLIDKTYRLMRVVDHGQEVLEKLYGVVSEKGQKPINEEK